MYSNIPDTFFCPSSGYFRLPNTYVGVKLHSHHCAAEVTNAYLDVRAICNTVRLKCADAYLCVLVIYIKMLIMPSGLFEKSFLSEDIHRKHFVMEQPHNKYNWVNFVMSCIAARTPRRRTVHRRRVR